MLLRPQAGPEVQGVVHQVKSLAGAWKADLGTRRHAMAESIKLKAILHLMKLRVLLVWLVIFLGNETCESLECNRSGRAPSSTCGQDQRSKSTMLHIEDTLFICSPLLTFVSSIASVSGGQAVHWWLRVEDSDIKKGWLFAFIPNICAGGGE